MGMDVRQMRYLVALADELNFTRAAKRCNVSQPPFSRAIRDLEEELGARLFERDKHRVSLTPVGAGVVADARRILAMLDESQERARRAARGLQGTLAIGFGGSTVYSLLPALVRNFRAEVKEVEIRFRAMAVLSQIDALRAGEIDLGIVRLPVHDEVIETRLVHREPLAVALPPGHVLLKNRSPVSIGQLATSRFVTYQPMRGFNYHADLHALCRLAGFTPDIAHEAPSTEAVIGIVACGEGVALVPASAERLHMEGVAFQPLDTSGLPDRLSMVEFALAWRKDNPTPATIEFVDRTTEWLASSETGHLPVA